MEFKTMAALPLLLPLGFALLLYLESLFPAHHRNSNEVGRLARASANYSLERHTVTTEDGYVLSLDRLPGRAGAPSILLMHGLLASSELWLVSDDSPGYLFADQGYDVWLGNARGTTLSRAHVNLTTADAEFWNFSWHEEGYYDLPAFVKYITKLKKDSLYYVGYSMGTTAFAVMASERPEIAKNIKAMVALAPATYMYHIRSPLKWIAPFWNTFQKTANILGIHSFFPRSYPLDLFASHVCSSALFQDAICANLMFMIGGFSRNQLDSNLLPEIWRTFPSGTSIKLYTHWMQQMMVNEFRQFDYGSDGNLQKYNSTVPLDYDLSKVQVPISVFWAKNDWLVHEEDAVHFYQQVPKKLGIYKIENDEFNHFDFLVGIDSRQLVYSKVIEVLTEHENQINRS